MTTIKSLALGSAAALFAVGAAQAADLPLKAKAVEYVKVCSLYGAGFYYIPGTDTCLRLGGYLRADLGVNTNSIFTGNTNGAGGAQNRFTNGSTWRARQSIDIDTRTATEYGVVRTMFTGTYTWTSGTYAGTTSGTSAYTGDAVAGGSLGVYYAFIQFAGFTIGKAVSQFSAPWTAYPGNTTFDGLVGGGGDVTGVNQFSYTAEFGNGVSASISAQDPTQYYQAGVNNESVTTVGTFGQGFGVSNYGGTVAPDIIGQLRVDQAWGLFQLSAAAHDNHTGYYGGGLPAAISGTELAGAPADKWGFAVQAALSIKNIPTGPGDTINIQGVYTDGATRYNIQDLASAAGSNVIFGGTSLVGAFQSVGFGFAPDTVYVTGGDQQLVQTWGMRGAYTHNWNPNWSTSLFGAYAAVRYNDTGKVAVCANFVATWGAGVTSCNPDYNIGQLGLTTRWTPVKNLTFTAEGVWTHLDQNMTGTVASVNNASIGKPAATYELKDQDTWTVMLRAQRNF